MGRLVRDSNMGTRETRRKLAVRKVPYCRLIVEGIHLGYYKGGNSRKWYVKTRTPEGKYTWQAIGSTDDYANGNGNGNGNGKTVLSYSQAQEKAKQIGERIRLGSDYEDAVI